MDRKKIAEWRRGEGSRGTHALAELAEAQFGAILSRREKAQ
jgi:hypothetical protein